MTEETNHHTFEVEKVVFTRASKHEYYWLDPPKSDLDPYILEEGVRRTPRFEILDTTL